MAAADDDVAAAAFEATLLDDAAADVAVAAGMAVDSTMSLLYSMEHPRAASSKADKARY